MRREITAGLRLVFGNPILRAISISKAAMGLSGGVIGTLVILYGIDTLGFEPGVLGTIFAVGGASSILGALNVGRLTRRFGLGRTLVVGFLIYGFSGFLIPMARGPLLVAGAILTAAQLFDFSMTAYEVNEVSLRQSITSRRLLGRVNASMEVTMLSFQLLGAVLAGVLAETVGMRWALFTGSCFMAAGGIWMLFSPVWRTRAIADSDTG
jgi:MFS family permease